MKTFKISIVGSGIVGQAVGKVFAKYGYSVIFFDIDVKKLAALSKIGIATSNLEEAILNSDISFFTLPTPTKNGRFDGSIIFSVFSEAMRYLVKKEGYHLFVIKSTTLPGFTESLIKKYKKYGSKSLGKDYGICSNPEFLRSETPMEDFENGECPVIIGESDPRSGKILENLYKELGRRANKKYQLYRTDPTTAEMVKYASNCLLATKISFFNQLKEICYKLKINPYKVVKLTPDKKIDEWVRTDFLKLGFQDECLPKDVEAFLTFCSKDLLTPMEILAWVKRVNDKIISSAKK